MSTETSGPRPRPHVNPKRDTNGIMQLEGVGAVETYQGVNYPATEIGGIKYVLTKMLSFEIDEARRRHWNDLLKAMPGVPLRKIRGLDLLAVGEKYHPGGMAGAGDSGEHPEFTPSILSARSGSASRNC